MARNPRTIRTAAVRAAVRNAERLTGATSDEIEAAEALPRDAWRPATIEDVMAAWRAAGSPRARQRRRRQ